MSELLRIGGTRMTPLDVAFELRQRKIAEELAASDAQQVARQMVPLRPFCVRDLADYIGLEESTARRFAAHLCKRGIGNGVAFNEDELIRARRIHDAGKISCGRMVKNPCQTSGGLS